MRFGSLRAPLLFLSSVLYSFKLFPKPDDIAYQDYWKNVAEGKFDILYGMMSEEYQQFLYGLYMVDQQYEKTLKQYVIRPLNGGFDAYVEEWYMQIRLDGYNDVLKVAKNTGLPEEEVFQYFDHVFRDVHTISHNGQPYSKNFFEGVHEMAESWKLAAAGDLTEEQLEWFKKQFYHEITESNKMAEGLPLHDRDTWNKIENIRDIDKTKSAHDAADTQPGMFPDSTADIDFEKHWQNEPEKFFE